EITFDDHVAPSIFEIAGARDIAVEFHSLSKTFCMTGWRLAWAAARPELIAALARVKNYVDTGAVLAVQAAGAAGLAEAAGSARRGWSRPPSGWERCSPLFEIRRPSLEFRRLTWVVSAVVHVAIIIVAFSGSWRIDRPQGLITIIPPARPQPPELPPFGGSRRGKGPSGGLGRPLPGGAAPDT